MVDRVHAAVGARFSLAQRSVLLLLGVTLLGMLLAACWLEPDPRGFGTHQQLGLAPCGVRLRWGIPCPTCGMTTCWSHLVRGDVWAACRAHVSGVVLAGWAALAAVWTLSSAWRGDWYWRPWGPRSAGLAGGALAVLLLVEWLLRLTWT